MKKILLALSLFIIAGCSNAQTNSIPPTIAPYRIQKMDNTYSTPADLKKNKPVMLIYFAPDCGHCQKLVYDMKPQMSKFKNIQVVMITFTDIKMVKGFNHDFNLSAYPNFTLGTEGYGAEVQKYYHIRTTPYIAIYDRSGRLVKSFDKVPEISDLADAVQKAS
ncbi:TlpA family protein disulfide reductase [Mucilaginibacter segetis]|uniref:Thioredoxin family protein n=1 Tax=Mucilaginibacter segetis TaxID=2793071 RepID=A0A934UNC2_9SPHI|nr:thioredoxin family protein [Mucilaginibacter segetis]MBK0380274.1 thioredoxin family protein [Mucilaginibacter segetis]